VADFNNATPEEIQSLMDVLRATRWTASDTPGKGNIPPFTPMQANGMIPAIKAAGFETGDDEEAAYLARLSPADRAAAERMLNERDLRMAQQFLQGRKQGMLPIAGYRTDDERELDRKVALMKKRRFHEAQQAQDRARFRKPGMLPVSPPAEEHQRRYPPIIGVRG
jgi:hypothetical protein